MSDQPEISARVRHTYLVRRIQEIQECREAVGIGNWPVIARCGHKLKGNAETFGLPHLGILGAELEVRAEEQNIEQVVRILDQLEKEVADSMLESEPESDTLV